MERYGIPLGEAVDGTPLSLILVLARQPRAPVPEDVPPDPPDAESLELLEKLNHG